MEGAEGFSSANFREREVSLNPDMVQLMMLVLLLQKVMSKSAKMRNENLVRQTSVLPHF